MIRSGCQPHHFPVAIAAAVANPVMQATGLSLPELDHFGDDAVAAPVHRARDILAFVGLLEAPLALLDGSRLTVLRTAAASALAARCFPAPQTLLSGQTTAHLIAS